MALVLVRAARPADVPDIARVQRSAWETGGFVPADVLDKLPPEFAENTWKSAVNEPPSPRHHVLVAQEQDWVVGFAAVGPATDSADGEIATLLVEPRWGRRGHGSRLLAAATDHLRGDGFQTVLAWISDRDKASRQFYESAGWEPDGLARTLDADGTELREIRLHASLS
jgi:GNAT superfamily N-acetyltransferase